MSDGRNSSLAWKINMNWVMRRLWSGVISMLLAICLCVLVIVIASEYQIALIYEKYGGADEIPEIPGYYIRHMESGGHEGFQPGFLAPLFPAETNFGYRNYYSAAISSGRVGPIYAVTVYSGGSGLMVGVELDFYISMANVLLWILAGWLILSWLLSIPKGARAARKILRPISDISRAAENLREPVRKAEREAPVRMEALEDAIADISLPNVDARVDVEGCQRELRGLASAINSMLDRIADNYKMQARFVSDASHELRTPISIIQGYANLLDRWGKEDPAALQESIDSIKGEAEYMKTLVEQLLFLARGDTEQAALKIEEFSVTELLDEVARETELIDKSHAISKLYQPGGIITLKADRAKLLQTVRILCDNAIKFTPEGGRITLDTESRDGSVMIKVQDNGAGISGENLPHVFDRFYRADTSRDRKTGGTGLGLSIAKAIVERHGGHFEITSWEGIGTRVTINIPQSGGQPEAGRGPQAPAG